MPFAVSRAHHSLLHRCGIVPMKKIFLWVSMAVIIWTAAIADAQERGQSPARVGWLWYGSAPTGALPSLETAIADGLRELGYVEGKTSCLNIDSQTVTRKGFSILRPIWSGKKSTS